MLSKQLACQRVNVEVSSVVDLLHQHEKNFAKPIAARTLLTSVVERIIDFRGQTEHEER